MKILFLSRWFPYPPSNGSKLRIYNLLQILATAHQVTLISFADQENLDPQAPDLTAVCDDIHLVPLKPFNPNRFKAKLGLLNPKPRFVIDTYSEDMATKINHVLQTKAIDLIIASQIDTAMYSKHIQHLPTIFEEIEVGVIQGRYNQAKGWRSRLRNGLTWLKYSYYLRGLLDHYTSGTVVSTQEKQLVVQATQTPTPIEVVPNFIRLHDYAHIHEILLPNTLIFTGAFSYHPNYEAMQWFLGQVHQLILSQIPGVRLTITGKHGNLPLPTTQNVTLTGFVDEIAPLVAQSWAAIVPLLTGGGTRLKILEAMALGTPVIATTKGAEGLEAEAGKHLLIADSPQDFAQATLRLLNDLQLRQDLSANGLELIRQKYDLEAVKEQFLSLVSETAYATRSK